MISNVIGNAVEFIDKILLKVKLPYEISRSTRSIGERFHYKANEYRTLALYLTVALFKDVLKAKYFKNLLKYIIFIRLLSQDIVSRDNLIDAQKIIQNFLTEFEALYTADAMTSNVHGHIHLAQQVWRFGPLNKLNAFPFENMLGITSDLYHGTRNYEGQIAKNLNLRKHTKFAIKKLESSTKNIEIKFFISDFLKGRNIMAKNLLLRERKQTIESLMTFEVKLLKKLNDFTNIEQTVSTGERAIINKREFHTFSYDLKFESLNCNCIQYESYGTILYGYIINFIVFNRINLCIIKKLVKQKFDYFYSSLNEECLKHIDSFFLFVEEADHELIEWNQIKRRCIIMNSNGKVILTPCQDLEEPD